METQAFAERIAQGAQPGWVLGLIGELGTGKTQFVKGFAHGLGVREAVLSPTFALLHIYRSGRFPLYHIDFYRLESSEHISGAGLEEYLSPDGVTIIEWWDRWNRTDPPGLGRLEFEAPNLTDRHITYDLPGA